ncbi:MAG TPA: hypothetical protein VMU33_14470 [Burkholderiaceae bacterium]|nr:hypothetical protein [Burkholderiaceae bacterium]
MPTSVRSIPASHPAFEGHFPGAPLLPGVGILAEVCEALFGDGALRPDASGVKLSVAKFLAPVRPGACLQIDWTEAGGRLRFEVRLDDASRTLAATGQFERCRESSP